MNVDTLESSLDFTSESDDLFLGINASVYESLKEGYNDKIRVYITRVNFR